MNQVTVQKVYADLENPLKMTLLTELPEGDIALDAPDVHRPGMAMMGFMENFLPHRVQVLGESEMAYLDTLDPAGQDAAVSNLAFLEAPVIFITRGLRVPDPVLTAARENGIPVVRSTMPTEEFIRDLSAHLSDVFAPRLDVHGTLVDVYGVGMLITGKSGIGKSECALDLVERGHRLVADDVVEVCKVSEDVIIGRFREVLQHNIEIRGVGVVDVQAVFGIRGIRMQKRIEVAVDLQRWRDDTDYERMGLERDYTEYLGVQIPRIIVPIFPGKNITVIAEVIALDSMLRVYGIDSAHDLNRRIMETLHSGDRLSRYLRHDRE
ncbi:HPr(Ser) kinase/phosphatase [bacterium]|nr:HPr(Ser) kinase/phosphatase [bacterium]MBU1072283.1 HPr(Ser) kinase/phosphatase [bacterium]MBU1674748.1 HPr(Ser) kinase/phosphatase [bacterium]